MQNYFRIVVGNPYYTSRDVLSESGTRAENCKNTVKLQISVLGATVVAPKQ